MVGISERPLPSKSWSLARKAQGGRPWLRFTARLVEPHIRKTYHVALRITRNREDAEDASQQSLINAYSHMDQFRGQARFSSWLLRIAINEALIKVRKRRSEDRHLFCRESDSGAGEPVRADSLRASDASHPEEIYSVAENQRFPASSDQRPGARRGPSYIACLALQERASQASSCQNPEIFRSRPWLFASPGARRQMRESIARQVSSGSCHGEQCGAF